MADRFAAGRVADLEGGTVAGRYPLAIYEKVLAKQPGGAELGQVPGHQRDQRLS